jgi:predicted PurR-regulated permease PerM
MLVAAITHEVTSLYNLLDQKSSDAGGFSPFITQLIDKPMQFVGRFIDVSTFNLRAWLAGRLQQISGFVFAQAGMILGNLTSFIVSTVVAFFTLFFLFREGRTMRRRAAAVLPLSAEQVDKLFTGINNIIIATVYGGGVVAAVQGAMVGIALWVLGVPSPVLWSLVAAFFALIPLVGTAAVWLPAALYLGFTGSWVKAIILVAWGAGVVGLVDNFLRPYLISGRVQMHTLLVFFSLFGGATVFGFLGLFIGPVIIAVTITLLSMLRDELRAWQEFWHEQPAGVAPPVTPVVDEAGTPTIE